MDWLRHDTDSRDDPKLLRLEAIYGNEGYAYFWKAVEVIAQQGGSLPREDALLAFRIAWRMGSKQRAKCEEVLSNLLATGLLTEANGEIVSRRLQGELEYADELREKRSKAGRRSGEVRRASGGSDEGDTCSTNDKQVFNTCSTQVEPDLTDLTNLPNQPTLAPPISPSRGTADSQTAGLPRNYASLEVDLERPDPALPWREWCKGKGGQPIHAARAGQILKGGTLKLAVYIPGEDGKRGRWDEQDTNLDLVEREVRVELLAAAMNQVLLNERDRGNFRIVETRFAESLDKWVREQPKVKQRSEAEVQAQVEEAKRLRKDFLAKEAAQKQARVEAGL